MVVTSHGVMMHDLTVSASLVAKLLCCLPCCLVHTQVKRIQSVPLVIGQFLEAIDQNYAIVGSTTGWVWLGGCGRVGVAGWVWPGGCGHEYEHILRICNVNDYIHAMGCEVASYPL